MRPSLSLLNLQEWSNVHVIFNIFYIKWCTTVHCTPLRYLSLPIKSKETDEVLNNKNCASQEFVAVHCFSSPCSAAISTLSYSWTPLRRKRICCACVRPPPYWVGQIKKMSILQESKRGLWPAVRYDSWNISFISLSSHCAPWFHLQ